MKTQQPKLTSGPWITRRKLKSNHYHLIWNHTNLNELMVAKLRVHMVGLQQELASLVDGKRQALPGRCTLSCGITTGYWFNCPADFASIAEANIKQRHAAFFEENYEQLIAEQNTQ